MHILHGAEFTVVDSSTQAALTALTCSRLAVSFGKALDELPHSISQIIDTLEMRSLAPVPTEHAFTQAILALLLEEHADWANRRFLWLTTATSSDPNTVAYDDTQLRAFAHYVTHDLVLPLWTPSAAPRSMASLLRTPESQGQRAIAYLVAAGATPLMLIATVEGIILCGDAEGVASAHAERRFQRLRLWQTHGTIEGRALRQYIGLELPWSDDMLYYMVGQWAQLHGLNVRNLPNDDEVKRELQQHLATVSSNLQEQQRAYSEHFRSLRTDP